MDLTVCPICEKSFSRSYDVSRHMREVHKKEEVGLEPETSKPVLQSKNQQFVFRHPFTAILAGPTCSGKTTLLKNILQRKDHLIKPPPTSIIWYYKRWQPTYQELLDTVPGIEFREGLPETPSYCTHPTVYVLDDLMSDASESQTICNLFIEGSHHLNISVFYLMQNAFYKSKHNRSMQINASYLILFKNPRNNIQPAIIARDMFPTNWRAFLRKYHEATSKPFGYLLIDFKQETPDDQRIITDIIPEYNDHNQHKLPIKESNVQSSDIDGEGVQAIVPWIRLKTGKNMIGKGEDYKTFLNFLTTVSLHQLKSLVSHFNIGQITALREVMRNILSGNVKLTSEQKKLLRPYKNFIIKFAHSSVAKCKLNRYCRAILLALQAAKSTFNQI